MTLLLLTKSIETQTTKSNKSSIISYYICLHFQSCVHAHCVCCTSAVHVICATNQRMRYLHFINFFFLFRFQTHSVFDYIFVVFFCVIYATIEMFYIANLIKISTFESKINNLNNKSSL